jgi:hemolysin III
VSGGASVHVAALTKPRWRGRLHQIAFIVSIPSGLALVTVAADWMSRLSAAIYALSLSGLYGVSASYHRIGWTAKAHARMRKLDHSMIFVLIAGTYTPFSLIVLDGQWAMFLLAAVWIGALFGIVVKLIGIDRMRRLGGSLYIIIGWLAVLATPQFVPRLPIGVSALILGGGILYTLGAVVLLRRWPDPDPLVFGYHEIWHVMVVAASVCHYAAVMWIVLTF